jgi:signal transduction histidine kinase
MLLSVSHEGIEESTGSMGEWHRWFGRRMGRLTRQFATALLWIWPVLAGAQDFITLEQASSRSGRDMSPAYEGQTVSIRAQVATAPVWALDTYYLPVRDSTDHGLLIRGDLPRFAEIVPGDWIECQGKIQSVGGMPLLDPARIRKAGHDVPPEPKDLTIADLSSFRNLGLVVRINATVSGLALNLGGRSLEVSDHGNTISVFLPRQPGNNPPEFPRVRTGDHVRLTGVATQYSIEPPHDSGFQLLLASPRDLEVVSNGSGILPLVLAGAAALILIVLALWWTRERRLAINRRLLREFHALSEDIIAAGSAAEIAQKLVTVLPTVTQATGVRLYLYSRRTKALERVPTKLEPEPVAVPLDAPADGLGGAAVVCFRNRTLLNVPDVRRSPFVNADARLNLPRSAMFLPLLSQGEVMGVLEVGNARRIGYFSLEEQAAAQHLANQVAASLKLQEQQTIREQLFRSEKLAATGQLISGVASELRAPLESIVQLSNWLGSYAGQPVPERELRMLGAASRRASEIVSRLVSFARPEDSAARHVDINALMANLMQFRDPEWRTLGLRVQNRVAPETAVVLGAQGQIEQVFLNLLVHAEQYASESPAKTICVSSTLIARRITVEIAYSVALNEHGVEIDPFAEGRSPDGTLGLGVCQGIIQSHGGEIRFRNGSKSDAIAMARFEIDLPIARESGATEHKSAARKSAASMTVLLVDPDIGGQRQLLGQLSTRGHRVVPAAMEESADLAQRMRFDAAFWAVRPSAPGSSEYQERVRAHVPHFVLVSDAYDSELAGSLESSGGFLLARPVLDTDLDRMLKKMDSARDRAVAVRP